MTKQSGPRYVVRPRNNTFHVFDTIWYGVVGSAPNAQAAQRRADDLNARKPAPRGRA
jgi:hypothetical protein